MSRPKGKINVVCQNRSCHSFQKEKGKDVVKRGFNRTDTHDTFVIIAKDILSNEAELRFIENAYL